MPRATDLQEAAYSDFRMRLILGVVGVDDRNRPVYDHQSVAVRHAEGLKDWLAQPENCAWAATVTMSHCRRHDFVHTLLDCLRAELVYWQARSSEVSHVAAIGGNTPSAA